MKAWWLKQAARIDALSVRERLFLFLSIVVVAAALADVVWLTPVHNTLKQAQLRVAAQAQEMARLQTEVLANATPVDANKTIRDELATLQEQVQAVDAQIDQIAPATPGGPGLQQVLVQFLRRQEGLVLQSANTLPDNAGEALPAGLKRQGVALSVSGPYAALVAYVQSLETALPLLRWGTMELKAPTGKPPELTLQVYVLGVQP